jgi:hypothetical protein
MGNLGLTLWTYLRWSLEFLYAPPFAYVTLVISLSFIASVVRQRPFHATNWKQNYSLVMLQFLFFPSTLIVASIGAVPLPRLSPNYWGLRALDVFAIGSLVVGAYWTWRMKGLRWFAVSLTLLQLWVLAGAQFIGGMALSGDWL